MFFGICLVTMATIKNLTFIHSSIAADMHQTSFNYQLHMQWQYTNTQVDLPLSHITILSIFFQLDLNSLDLDLGQGHLNTFLSFSSKGSIITPNLKAFGAILTELGQIYCFLVNCQILWLVAMETSFFSKLCKHFYQNIWFSERETPVLQKIT